MATHEEAHSQGDSPTASQISFSSSLLADDTHSVPSAKIEPVAIAEGSPATQKEGSHSARKLLAWLKSYGTLVLMLSFGFGALVNAIGHALFFVYLDGSRTGDSKTDARFLRQSYTTIISLLLVTLFKTCVLAAVSLAFTQHLWLILRKEVTTVSRVEQIFSIRSNPFLLAMYNIALSVPMLFTMAVFAWLVPIAAIYPPSALTVVSRSYSPMRQANVPILFPGKTENSQTSPALAMYKVNISYNGSSRHIDHTIRDLRPIPLKNWLRWNLTHDEVALFNNSEAGQSVPYPFPVEAKPALELWEARAILDASSWQLTYDCANWVYKNDTHRLEDGTIVDGVRANVICPDILYYQQLLDRSIFNPGRYNESNRNFSPWDTISEQTINDFIANVTIAALSLNIAEAATNVTFLEYHTTYSFSAPINLILPYVLMTGFMIIFMAIGILSLHRNGTPVVDGGFMQIMMATVGRTRMEDMVIQHQKGDEKDEPPQELLDLKTRYGELLDDEGIGAGVAGFGTKEETRLLRKGSSSA